MIRRPSLKRPPGPPAPPHDWRWSPQPTRLPWGFLATTGPGEQSYVAGDGTLDGDGYECSRCGCVRLCTWLWRVDADGDEHRHWVALHGFDWASLAPMNAPSCDVLERPGEGSVAA